MKTCYEKTNGTCQMCWGRNKWLEPYTCGKKIKHTYYVCQTCKKRLEEIYKQNDKDSSIT